MLRLVAKMEDIYTRLETAMEKASKLQQDVVVEGTSEALGPHTTSNLSAS